MSNYGYYSAAGYIPKYASSYVTSTYSSAPSAKQLQDHINTILVVYKNLLSPEDVKALHGIATKSLVKNL